MISSLALSIIKYIPYHFFTTDYTRVLLDLKERCDIDLLDEQANNSSVVHPLSASTMHTVPTSKSFSFKKRMILSVVFCALLYVIVVVVGGICFHKLEIGHERQERIKLRAAHIAFLKTFDCVSPDVLHQYMIHVIRAAKIGVIPTSISNFSRYDSVQIPEDWIQELRNSVDTEFFKVVGKISEAELLQEEMWTGNWNIDQAIFFGISVITTVGYGKVSPSTPSGKVFCILFACFGIPINLIFSSILVNLCMPSVRWSRNKLVKLHCPQKKNIATAATDHHDHEPMFSGSGADRTKSITDSMLTLNSIPIGKRGFHSVHFEQGHGGQRQPRVMRERKHNPDNLLHVPQMMSTTTGSYTSGTIENQLYGENADLDQISRRDKDVILHDIESNGHSANMSNESKSNFFPIGSNSRVEAPQQSQDKASRPKPKLRCCRWPQWCSKKKLDERQDNGSLSDDYEAAAQARHSDNSDSQQYSSMTSSMGGNSCLALAHFFLAKCDWALNKGMPLATHHLDPNRKCIFRAHLLHFLGVILLVLLLTIVLPAFVFHYFELGWSLLDAFYFCVISMTLVGLGDLVPEGYNYIIRNPTLISLYVKRAYTILTSVYLLLGSTLVLLAMRVFEEVFELDANHDNNMKISRKFTLISLSSDGIFGPVSAKRPKISINTKEKNRRISEGSVL